MTPTVATLFVLFILWGALRIHWPTKHQFHYLRHDAEGPLYTCWHCSMTLRTINARLKPSEALCKGSSTYFTLRERFAKVIDCRKLLR